MSTTEPQAPSDDELRARPAAGSSAASGTRRGDLVADPQDTGVAMTRSEERLVPSTEVYETGRARLRKYVITEDVQITVRVRRHANAFVTKPMYLDSFEAVVRLINDFYSKVPVWPESSGR